MAFLALCFTVRFRDDTQPPNPHFECVPTRVTAAFAVATGQLPAYPRLLSMIRSHCWQSRLWPFRHCAHCPVRSDQSPRYSRSVRSLLEHRPAATTIPVHLSDAGLQAAHPSTGRVTKW